MTVPDWVNDLHSLEFGRGYWINVSQALILLLKGASDASAAQEVSLEDLDGIPLPPAMYYGRVLLGSDFVPEAGMTATASVGDTVCGRGITRVIDGAVVYSVNVSADGPGAATGCGAVGRPVVFQIGSHRMATAAAWDISRVWELSLRPNAHERLFLPVILANR